MIYPIDFLFVFRYGHPVVIILTCVVIESLTIAVAFEYITPKHFHVQRSGSSGILPGSREGKGCGQNCSVSIHRAPPKLTGGNMKTGKKTTIAILVTALMMTWAIPLMAADMGKVNINSATKEILMGLDGIGEAYAERIIAYREQNGPFQSAEDILKVKGIGEKIFEANKNRIVVKDQ